MKRLMNVLTTRWMRMIPAMLVAAALAAAPLAAPADIGSALKKAGEGVKKGTEDLKGSIENTRDRHITKPTTPDEMAKAADQQLKDAQAQMFKGEKEKARAGAIEAAGTILLLKEAAPEHEKVSGLENRANKLATDLKNRGVQDLDIWAEAKKAASAEAAPEEQKADAPKAAPGDQAAPAAPATATAAKAEKLPYAAEQAMIEYNKQMRSIESSYNFIELYKQEGEPAEKWLVKLDEAEKKIAAAEEQLATARAKAAEKNVTAHPDFDAADTRIAAEKERLVKAREEAKTAQAGAAASKAGVEADVDAFVAEFERLNDKYFTKFSGTAVYANDIEPVEEVIALIEDFEKNEMDKAKATLKSFTNKYGATLDDVRAKVQAAGYEGQKQPEFKVPMFQEGLDNVARQRAAEFDSIMAHIDLIVENLSKRSDFSRLEAHDQVREWLKLAERADAAKAKEKAGAIEDKLAADAKTFEAKITGAAWPGSTKSAEADAAAKFFQESEDWCKNAKNPCKVLGIVVRGDWSVQQRNLAGNPVMYGLPVWVAFQMDSEKDTGLARVFNLTMRTLESGSAKPEPPFTSVTVGDSWYMKADKVK